MSLAKCKYVFLVIQTRLRTYTRIIQSRSAGSIAKNFISCLLAIKRAAHLVKISIATYFEHAKLIAEMAHLYGVSVEEDIRIFWGYRRIKCNELFWEDHYVQLKKRKHMLTVPELISRRRHWQLCQHSRIKLNFKRLKRINDKLGFCWCFRESWLG